MHNADEVPRVVGHLHIDPPLNPAEADWVAGFRGGFLGGQRNPFHRGQPPTASGWEVCAEGCCLWWVEGTDPAGLVAWLRWLIGEFLKSSAGESKSKRFREFTFDHRLDGCVVRADRGGNVREIRVSGNRVSERALGATVGCADHTSHLHVLHQRRRRRQGVVVDLASRRTP